MSNKSKVGLFLAGYMVVSLFVGGFAGFILFGGRSVQVVADIPLQSLKIAKERESIDLGNISITKLTARNSDDIPYNGEHFDIQPALGYRYVFNNYNPQRGR